MSNYEYREAMRNIFVDYNSSPQWKNVVEQVKYRDNNTCQDCGKKDCKLIVHHEKYDNWGKGDQAEIKDCVLLCQKCHNLRHRNNFTPVPFWAKRETTFEPTVRELKDWQIDISKKHPLNKMKIKTI